jgi:hypothetical protein
MLVGGWKSIIVSLEPVVSIFRVEGRKEKAQKSDVIVIAMRT